MPKRPEDTALPGRYRGGLQRTRCTNGRGCRGRFSRGRRSEVEPSNPDEGNTAGGAQDVSSVFEWR